MRIHQRPFLAVAALIAFASLLPGRAARAAEGAESVEALMKLMDTAAKSGDAGQVLALIHPDDRPLYGFGMIMAGSFAPMAYMNDEKKADAATQEWDALLAKHKIDMKASDAPMAQDPAEIKMRARALFKSTDLKAFVNDAGTFVKKHAGSEGKGQAIPGPTGALVDLKVDGDNAIGKIDGKEQKFSKVDGRWYIRVDM